MSFSPRDWPQLPAKPSDSRDSSGPEWRALLARLDAAHHARMSLNDAGKLNHNGSFSPGSADRLGSLAEDSEGGRGGDFNEVESDGNHSVSANGKSGLPDGSDDIGTHMPGRTRD